MLSFIFNTNLKNSKLKNITNKFIIRNKYNSKIFEHFENPKNVGSLDKNKKNVGIGIVGAPACGDVMKLSIEVDENTGIIKDAKFKTFGCGSAIASSSIATEMLIGKNLDESIKITNKTISQYLKLPPVKLHCSILAEDAIKASIKNYLEKKQFKF